MALLTGTVTGRFEDTIPGVTEPITGTVYFTAEADYLLSDDSTVLPAPVAVVLVNSAFNVALVATDDPTLNPVNFSYSVTFALKASGYPIKREPFSIEVPAGVTTNLATVTPVASSAGNAVVRGLKGDTGETGPLGPQGATAPGVFNVLDYGAIPDAQTDSAPAINAAILAAHNAGGGVVIIPTGSYAVASSIGFSDRYIRNVRLTGTVPRGVRWRVGGGNYSGEDHGTAGTHIRALGNIPVLGGMWDSCEISWLGLDGDGQGSPCVKAHFSKTIFERNEIVRWSNHGMILNDGAMTDEIGFLNRVLHNNISDSGWEWGNGLTLEYRFSDSWIEGNNIEAHGGSDIVIRSGGPHRILNNHLNGNRSPKHNILIEGGVRNCIIYGNIMEKAEEEAIKYIAPGWLTDPEMTALTISHNIFRDFAQQADKPAMGIYGTTGNANFYALGLSVVANSVVTDHTPSYVLDVNGFKDISAIGNFWRDGHAANLAPVRAINCTGVEVIGNHGDNAIVSA